MNELKEQMVILSGLFNQMQIQKVNKIHMDTSKVSAFGLKTCFFSSFIIATLLISYEQ